MRDKIYDEGDGGGSIVLGNKPDLHIVFALLHNSYVTVAIATLVYRSFL